MQEAKSPIIATRRLYERVLLATALSGALLVLGVGLSIYVQALRNLNDAAKTFAGNLVEKHRESLAIEAFLSPNGAYEARLEQIRTESRARTKLRHLPRRLRTRAKREGGLLR